MTFFITAMKRKKEILIIRVHIDVMYCILQDYEMLVAREQRRVAEAGVR